MTERVTIRELARAYEGLERADAFVEPGAVAEYRAAVLERNRPQARFVAQQLEPAAEVLEIGCGNGRLLVDLALQGHCSRGLGLDLAQSRIAFAQTWAADAGAEGLRFEVADALARDLGQEAWDAVLCVTSAFAYFEPLRPGAAAELATRMRAALRPGGRLVLELYPHVEWRRMLHAAGRHDLRLWHELPEDDPWRFYLSELHLDGDTLTHTKTFVHRHDGRVDDSGRREQLHLYTPDSLASLLGAAGFTDVRAHGGWDGRPYEDDELLVVTARRPA